MYVALADEPGFSLAVLLRTSGAPAASDAAVRGALHDLDPDLALCNVHALDELSHIVRWSSRTISVVLVVFGLIAFALSTAACTR